MHRFILPTIFLACAVITAGEPSPATPSAATVAATTQLAAAGVSLLTTDFKWKPQAAKDDRVLDIAGVAGDRTLALAVRRR